MLQVGASEFHCTAVENTTRMRLNHKVTPAVLYHHRTLTLLALPCFVRATPASSRVRPCRFASAAS